MRPWGPRPRVVCCVQGGLWLLHSASPTFWHTLSICSLTFPKKPSNSSSTSFAPSMTLKHAHITRAGAGAGARAGVRKGSVVQNKQTNIQRDRHCTQGHCTPVHVDVRDGLFNLFLHSSHGERKAARVSLVQEQSKSRRRTKAKPKRISRHQNNTHTHTHTHTHEKRRRRKQRPNVSTLKCQ